MAKETTDPAELSKEELAERRREIKEYYEDNIPSLKVQLEYENLLRDIEKSRAERLQAQMFIAQTMAAPPGEDDMPPVSNELAQKEAAARAKGKAQAEAIKAQMKAEAETAITDNNKRTLKPAK